MSQTTFHIFLLLYLDTKDGYLTVCLFNRLLPDNVMEVVLNMMPWCVLLDRRLI